MIFTMTSTAVCAFAAATQGWLLTRNRPPEVVLLLLAVFVLMQPGLLAGWTGVPAGFRHWFYIPGLALFAGALALQHRRANASPAQPAV
jgi:TRAP-type uncharacterized transport system fused permease subunit